MEVTRSAFSSHWRLFRNDLGIKTPGKYVFVSPGTPFAPVPTWLWSGEWISKNMEDYAGLGEVWPKEKPWQEGTREGRIALPVLLGSLACISGGEPDVNDHAPELVDGYDIRCPFAGPGAAGEWPHGQLTDCHVQHYMFRGIEILYTATSVDEMDDWLAERYVKIASVWLPNTVNFPPVYIARTTVGALVVFAGTTTTLGFTQWAEQLLRGADTPQDFGDFSTLQIWYDASQRVLTAMEILGTSATDPIFITGHSYGGAGACILAGRLRVGQPTRDIRLLTCGCPRPGDRRLANILLKVASLHICNEGDPVPCIPPPIGLIPTVTGVDLVYLQRLYMQWERAVPKQVLYYDGRRDTNHNCLDTVQETSFWVIASFLGVPLSPGFPHLISEYRRLTLCPGEEPEPPPIPGELAWTGEAGVAVVATGENVSITPG